MYNTVTRADIVAKDFTRFANQDLKLFQIINYIKKYLKNNAISTVLSLQSNEKVPVGDIMLTAYYDPDSDESGDVPFELLLVTHPETKSINWDSKRWRDFSGSLIEYLDHELIHQHQYRARDYINNRSYVSKSKDPKVRKVQTYLGDPDEIDAYSHSLCSHFLRKTKDFDHALRLLRTFSNTAITRDQAGRLLSPDLFGYMQGFDFDNRHPVIKKLIKKTYQRMMHEKKLSERKERIKARNEEIIRKEIELEEKQNTLDAQAKL